MKETQRNINVNFCLILLPFLVVSCYPSYKTAKVEELDEDVLSMKVAMFRDSLLKENFPVLTISQDCHGCIKGMYHPVYIYWKEDGLGFVKKIDNYGTNRIVRTPINFIKCIDLYQVKTGDYIEEPLLNYHYTLVSLYEPNSEVIFRMKLSEGYRKSNIKSNQAMFLAQLRSNLLELEQNPISGF